MAIILPEYYTPSLINWTLIPERMREELHMYIQRGRPPGDFLMAVFCNDLKETFARADDMNKPIIENYVLFMYQYAPFECWRSKENVQRWMSHGGLDGFATRTREHSESEEAFENNREG